MKERFIEIGKLMLIIIGILLTVYVFTGCAARVEYVPKVEIKEIKVPVALDVKRIECEFYSEHQDIVIDKMLICLKKYKTYNEALIKAADEINRKK